MDIKNANNDYNNFAAPKRVIEWVLMVGYSSLIVIFQDFWWNFSNFDMFFEKMVKFYTKAMLNFIFIEEIPPELYPKVKRIFLIKKSVFRGSETSFFKTRDYPARNDLASQELSLGRRITKLLKRKRQ